MDIVTKPGDFDRISVRMVLLEPETDERATLLLVHEDQDEQAFARRIDAPGFETGTYVELESIDELAEIARDYWIEVSPKLERWAKSKGLSVLKCLADAYLNEVVGGVLRRMYPGMAGLALCRRLNLIEDLGAAPPVEFLVERGWDLVLRVCDLQLPDVLSKVATYEAWEPGHFEWYVFTADGFVVAWFDDRWRAYDYREHLEDWLLGSWEGEVDEAAFDRRYNELLTAFEKARGEWCEANDHALA